MKGLTLLWFVLLALPAAAIAHPLAPGLLELTEVGPARYAVHWRTSVARAGSARVEARLPADCAQLSKPDPRVVAGEALVARWLVACAGGLAGRAVGVEGLPGSGINVIVKVLGRDGAEFQALLGADQPDVIVAAQPASIFQRYLRLGGEHLIVGADHLLFLLALVLLVTGVRRLVVTVTAFTVGHTVTLSLATLGLVPVSQALAESLIALTLLIVALQILKRDQIRKRGQIHYFAENVSDTFILAGVFGLVHGLGFAGALREAGLPAQDLPLVLFAFNVGIELAQLGVVAVLGCVVLVMRRLPTASVHVPAVAAYVTGSLAICWLLERSVTLLA